MTTRIDSGARRHRVTVQEVVTTTNAVGEEIPTWLAHENTWGRAEQLGGRELLAAAQTTPTATHKVTVPYLSSITEAMRVQVGDRTLQIESVEDRDFEGVEMVLLCSETK